MAVYAADHGAPSVDWTNHPAISFQCLNDAIKPFRHDALKIDEVLTSLAFEVYRAGMSLQKSTGPVWLKWTSFLEQKHYLPISEEVRLHLTAMDDRAEVVMNSAGIFAATIDDLRQAARSPELFEEEITKLLLEIKDWLLKCACHHSLDVDGSLLREIRAIIVQQPRVDLSKKGNFKLQRSERLTGGFGIWPDLTRTLTALRPPSDQEWSSKDDENAVMAVASYLCLAANMIPCHLFMEAEPTSFEHGMEPFYEHIFGCEQVHARLIESPFSPYPLKVRQVLSEANYLGNSLLISSTVLPNINTGNLHVAFLMFRWVMLAATHRDADPTGKVRLALSKIYDLECLTRLPELCSRHAIFLDLNVPGQANPGRFFNSDIEWTENDQQRTENTPLVGLAEDNAQTGLAESHTITKMWNERVHEAVLHPHWNLDFTFGGNVLYKIDDPLHDVSISQDFPRVEDTWLEQHMQCIPNPKPDDDCLICKDDFTETPCYATVCNHLYHLDCLREWQKTLRNAGSSASLACCYCTKDVMDEDALIDLAIERHKDVPIHVTPEMYKQQMEGAVSFGLLFQA